MAQVVKSDAALLADMAAPVAQGCLAMWWLGQAGFAVKGDDTVVYIDPYLSNYCAEITKDTPLAHERMTPAPLDPAQVSNADFILCTHDHIDHLDPWGIPAIAAASPQARFVVPPAAVATLIRLGISSQRVVPLAAGNSANLGPLWVTALRAKHEEFDYDPDLGYPYLSFIVILNSVTLYHAGDTIPFAGQHQELAPFQVDVALLPINGRDEARRGLGLQGNLTYREAADLAAFLSPRLTIPMHYDMFTINTERVERFVAYMAGCYPLLPYRVPAVGEKMVLCHETK